MIRSSFERRWQGRLHIVPQPILDEQVRDALHALPGKPQARAICGIVSGASSIARRPPMTVMLKGQCCRSVFWLGRTSELGKHVRQAFADAGRGHPKRRTLVHIGGERRDVTDST